MSFSKSKPSNYVTKEQIERARNVDMVEFLERTEGFSVKKSGNGYRCDKHDSLFITNDRRGWYWNSRDEGGNNAIAFCMKIYGQSFTEAVKSLCGDIQIEYTPNKITSKPSVSKDKESNRLILPEQDHKENGQRNYSNVIAYLCKTRGLEYSIVNQLIYDRKLYQGVGYSGLQLVGYDSSNTPFYRFKMMCLKMHRNMLPLSFRHRSKKVKSISAKGSAVNIYLSLSNVVLLKNT